MVSPPCYGCGLTDAEPTCTLESPFTDIGFDHSHKSIEIAKSVVEKGLNQLATLDEALHRLQKRRDHLHRIIAKHQNYLPPISRLPDDVLLLIFQEATRAVGPTLWGSTVWILAAICTRWRLLALSCSSLWTTVDLDLRVDDEMGALEEPNALLLCRRALLQLDRAGKQPLMCFVDLTCVRDTTYRHPTIPQSVRQIVSQFHRCRSIVMLGDGPNSWNSFGLATPTFKSLRSLDWASDSSTNPGQTFPRFFHDAPMLDHLSIVLVQLSSPFPTSWKDLTALKLHSCFAIAPELIDLLSFTEKLVTLSLHVRAPDDYMMDPTLPIPPVTKIALLPNLNELSVDFGWSWPLELAAERNPLWTGLHHIRCPLVSTVRVSAPTAHNSDIEAVQECLLASGNPSLVRSITFKDLADEDLAAPLITLISKLPSLESLSIDSGEDRIRYDSVLTALHRPASIGWDLSEHHGKDEEAKATQFELCPRLTRIRLSGWSLDSGLLREVITSRASNSALGHVITEDLAFTDDPPPSGDHLDWLRDMPQKGLLEAIQIVPSGAD